MPPLPTPKKRREGSTKALAGLAYLDCSSEHTKPKQSELQQSYEDPSEASHGGSGGWPPRE
jgi:hypothetical protein